MKEREREDAILLHMNMIGTCDVWRHRIFYFHDKTCLPHAQAHETKTFRPLMYDIVKEKSDEWRRIRIEQSLEIDNGLRKSVRRLLIFGVQFQCIFSMRQTLIGQWAKTVAVIRWSRQHSTTCSAQKLEHAVREQNWKRQQKSSLSISMWFRVEWEIVYFQFTFDTIRTHFCRIDVAMWTYSCDCVFVRNVIHQLITFLWAKSKKWKNIICNWTRTNFYSYEFIPQGMSLPWIEWKLLHSKWEKSIRNFFFLKKLGGLGEISRYWDLVARRWRRSPFKIAWKASVSMATVNWDRRFYFGAAVHIRLVRTTLTTVRLTVGGCHSIIHSAYSVHIH